MAKEAASAMPYSHAFQIEQKRVGGGRDDTKRNDRERRKGKQRVGAARQLESNIYRNAAKKCTKRKKTQRAFLHRNEAPRERPP